MPANLIESELFGHERGAFTGATLKREGRFAVADGGTLFLDEVGELPLELQAKLLRVLQEGEFEPVGSSRTRKVDVRVVAATNRDLAAEVRAARFREDLFYRLNVFPIRLPALRERTEDIPALVDLFLQRCATRLGRRFEPVPVEGIRRLQDHSWPGNVRELQNVVERAAIASRDGRLDFARALHGGVATHPAGATTPAARVLTVKELEEIERANLLLALDATGWRVSGENGAARLLDINPSTLASRIKALGLRRPHDPEAAARSPQPLPRRMPALGKTIKELHYA
jgi:transcriptional regulator with GAF, ATPase, and Fis domain